MTRAVPLIVHDSLVQEVISRMETLRLPPLTQEVVDLLEDEVRRLRDRLASVTTTTVDE